MGEEQQSQERDPSTYQLYLPSINNFETIGITVELLLGSKIDIISAQRKHLISRRHQSAVPLHQKHSNHRRTLNTHHLIWEDGYPAKTNAEGYWQTSCQQKVILFSQLQKSSAPDLEAPQPNQQQLTSLSCFLTQPSSPTHTLVHTETTNTFQ